VYNNTYRCGNLLAREENEELAIKVSS